MSRVTTRWWWVRHAPVVGYDGVVYGNSEVPCDTSDSAAIGGLAARLPEGALWVTSNLGRARKTAAALAAALDGPGVPRPDPMVERDLAEQDFGDWQGRRYADLDRADDAYHEFWLAPAHYTPPGGESFSAVVARVAGVIGRLTAAHAGRDIVAVAHGGSIRAALALALGVDAEAALAFNLDPLSLTRIAHVAVPGRGGKWRIAAVNQSAK